MNEQQEEADPDHSGTEPGPAAPLSSMAPGTASGPTLANRYEWLKAMIDQVPDYIYAKDRAGRFLFANQAVVHNNGFESVEELIGLTDAEIHGAAAISSRIAETERYVMESGRQHLGYEEPAMRGGPDRWLMMSRVPLRDANGDIIGVVGVSRDISVKKAAERLMQAQNRILEMIVASTDIPHFLQAVVRLLEGLSESLRCVLVVKPDDGDVLAVAESLSPLSADSLAALQSFSRNRIEEELRRLCGAGQESFAIAVPSSENGEYGYLAVSGHGTGPDRGNLLDFLIGAARMIGIAIDRSRTEAKLRYLAEHDPLTGLANRSVMERELEDLLRDAARRSERLAVCYLDLDRFKLVNDKFGHQAGDALLQQVGARLMEAIGGGELAARIGGDEFILVLQERNGDFAARIEAISNSIRQPIRHDDVEFAADGCIGVALFPDDGRESGQLLAVADAAMYEAKRAR